MDPRTSQRVLTDWKWTWHLIRKRDGRYGRLYEAFSGFYSKATQGPNKLPSPNLICVTLVMGVCQGLTHWNDNLPTHGPKEDASSVRPKQKSEWRSSLNHRGRTPFGICSNKLLEEFHQWTMEPSLHAQPPRSGLEASALESQMTVGDRAPADASIPCVSSRPRFQLLWVFFFFFSYFLVSFFFSFSWQGSNTLIFL